MGSLSLKQLRDDALELPETERAELAHDLVASLDGKPDTAAAEAWDTEILKRVSEIDDESAVLIDAEEISARIRARLSRD